MVGTNPETTRGREGKVTNLSYPVGEDLLRMTALRFVKYQRAQPSVAAAEEETSTIFLPLPMSLPENVNMRTSSIDMGKLGALNGNEAINSLITQGFAPFIDDLKALKDVAGGTDWMANRSIAALIPGIRDNPKAQVVLGAVQNPHTTQFFEGVNLRSFSLNWRFMPRSFDESRALKQICDEIDMRVHPEETVARLALDYPDLVYVDILGDAKDFLPKYRRAFVSNVQKTFGVSNGLALFSTGAPVDMELSISFTEVEVVTRNVLRGESGEATPSPGVVA